MSDAIGVAIVGFGDHVRKNIVRCLFGNPDIHVVGVHVRDLDAHRSADPDLAGLFTDDLQGLIDNPAVDAVYIATPISSHFDHARRALLTGKHVWCEKPLTDSLARTTELLTLSEARGLLAVEMAMYRRHAQFAALTRLLAEKAAAGEDPIEVNARFSIPALDPGNIRYSRAAGGGALLDVGYYPLAMATTLFGEPQAVHAVGGSSPASEVDLQGSALLSYGRFGVSASWAIGASYVNRLELSFARGRYVAAPVFSRPPDRAVPIEVFAETGEARPPIFVPADDQFANLFAELCAAVRQNAAQTRRRYAAEALAVARTLQAVRDGLGG